MSTVLDAALAVLLVTGAVAVLGGVDVTVGGEDVRTDATQASGTLLPSTVTVDPPTRDGTPVRGSLGALLAAAVDPDSPKWFQDGVCRAGASLLATVAFPVNVSAHSQSGVAVAVGPTPPPRSTVDAAVVTVETSRGRTELVVRTWSR